MMDEHRSYVRQLWALAVMLVAAGVCLALTLAGNDVDLGDVALTATFAFVLGYFCAEVQR